MNLNFRASQFSVNSPQNNPRSSTDNPIGCSCKTQQLEITQHRISCLEAVDVILPMQAFNLCPKTSFWNSTRMPPHISQWSFKVCCPSAWK